MPDAYYQVPVHEAKSIQLERGGQLGLTVKFPEVEETGWDHAVAAVVGLAFFAAGSATVPGLAGIVFMLVGGFFAGWAANNAVIAWRCERRENEGGVDGH